MTSEPVQGADDVAAEEYEPSILFGMFFPADLVVLADDLEQIRKRLCLYGPDAQRCDCKYLSGGKVGQGERSGCCELRAASRLLRSAEASLIVRLQKENDRYRRALNTIAEAAEVAAQGGIHGTHSDGRDPLGEATRDVGP